MSNISSYLDDRLKLVEDQIGRVKAKQKDLDDQISVISDKQKSFSENVDVTYELFSPKPVSPGDRRESVQILEVNKYELVSQKSLLEEQMKKLLLEKEKIRDSMADLRRMEAFINKVVKEYHLNQP